MGEAASPRPTGTAPGEMEGVSAEAGNRFSGAAEDMEGTGSTQADDRLPGASQSQRETRAGSFQGFGDDDVDMSINDPAFPDPEPNPLYRRSRLSE